MFGKAGGINVHLPGYRALSGLEYVFAFVTQAVGLGCGMPPLWG
jgi:hypothetical protein